jgi:hypothetical protein
LAAGHDHVADSLNKRMTTGDSEFMWPMLALIHAVLYLTLIFVTSILNKDKDEAASDDTVTETMAP